MQQRNNIVEELKNGRDIERVLGNGAASIAPRAEKLNQQYLENLASDPKNIVLVPKYDKIDRVMTSREVEYFTRTIRTRVLEACAEDRFADSNPRSRLKKLSAFRRELVTDDEAMEEFALTHPKIFEILSDPSTTQERIQELLQMIALRRDVENGVRTQESATMFVQQQELKKKADIAMEDGSLAAAVEAERHMEQQQQQQQQQQQTPQDTVPLGIRSIIEEVDD